MPRLVGRLGHVIISNVHVGGIAVERAWNVICSEQLLPYIRTAALKKPDKILVVVDRENRQNCCAELAISALASFQEGLRAVNLSADVAIVLSDKKFESIIMADYDLVDGMPILSRKVSPNFGNSLDGKDPRSILKSALKPGAAYHKVRHGAQLASKMNFTPTVLARSRSLRKLVKEIPNCSQSCL